MKTSVNLRCRRCSSLIGQRIRNWANTNNLLVQVAYWDEGCRKANLWEMLKIWYPIVICDGESLSDYHIYLADHLEVNVVGNEKGSYRFDMKDAPHYMEF